PCRSVKFSNSSSLTLNETLNGGSRDVAQNIFSATEKTRSLPHFTSSVAPGNARQILLKNSRSIFIKLLNIRVIFNFRVSPLFLQEKKCRRKNQQTEKKINH